MIGRGQRDDSQTTTPSDVSLLRPRSDRPLAQWHVRHGSALTRSDRAEMFETALACSDVLEILRGTL